MSRRFGGIQKKSLHLQLCNKLKSALRKSVHLYYTLPPKVQGSRKMKYCKNQRKWMTTNCALDTAQQLYKWNDSSRDCTYKTGRKSSHTKPQHEAGRNSCPQQKSYWWLRGRFFFFLQGCSLWEATFVPVDTHDILVWNYQSIKQKKPNTYLKQNNKNVELWNS